MKEAVKGVVELLDEEWSLPDPEVSNDLLKSYGAMHALLAFFTPMQVISMQHVNKWLYKRAIGRCQVKWNASENYFFFVHKYRNKIIRYNRFNQTVENI